MICDEWAVVLLDWILTGLDGIRMDFGWIGSVSPSLLDGLDHRPKIQLDPIAAMGELSRDGGEASVRGNVSRTRILRHSSAQLAV